MTDASQDEWWRHDDEPDERMRAQRRRSVSTRTSRQASELEAARRYQREAAPRQEVRGGEAARRPTRAQASARWGERGHDMPQISERRRRAVRAHQVQLTPRQQVPQIRDRTARNGGWNLPSLSARPVPRVPVPLVAAIAVLLVVLVILLVRSCAM